MAFSYIVFLTKLPMISNIQYNSGIIICLFYMHSLNSILEYTWTTFEYTYWEFLKFSSVSTKDIWKTIGWKLINMSGGINKTAFKIITTLYIPRVKDFH